MAEAKRGGEREEGVEEVAGWSPLTFSHTRILTHTHLTHCLPLPHHQHPRDKFLCLLSEMARPALAVSSQDRPVCRCLPVSPVSSTCTLSFSRQAGVPTAHGDYPVARRKATRHRQTLTLWFGFFGCLSVAARCDPAEPARPKPGSLVTRPVLPSHCGGLLVSWEYGTQARGRCIEMGLCMDICRGNHWMFIPG